MTQQTIFDWHGTLGIPVTCPLCSGPYNPYNSNRIQQTNVYWHNTLHIPGIGPLWSEPYNPDRTIGELIQILTTCNITAMGCTGRIEMFKYKHKIGTVITEDSLYWNHNIKLSEYVQATGGPNGKYLSLVCVVVFV
jgi:hypothetical protein